MGYLLALLFWVLIIAPLPVALKVVAIILVLLFADLEFLCLQVLIAGMFKTWGPIAEFNSILDVTLLAETLLVIRTLLLLLLKKRIKLDSYNKALLLGTGLFVFFMWLSLLYAIDPVNGLSKAERYILITLPILIIPIAINYVLGKADFLWKLAFYMLSHISAFSLIAIFSKTSFVLSTDYVGLGRMCGVAILICFLYVLMNIRQQNIGMALVGSVFMSINIWALLLTGSRAPTFSLILVLLISGLMLIKNPKYFIGYLISVVLVSMFTYNLVESNLKLLAFYNRTTEVLAGSYPLTRIDFYKTALEMFSKQPLTGFGLGSFGLYLTGLPLEFYPHNMLLELMAELGLIGLIFYGMFSLLSLAKIKQLLALTKDNDQFLIYGQVLILLFFLLNSFSSGDINSNKSLWFGVGILFSMRAKEIVHNVQ